MNNNNNPLLSIFDTSAAYTSIIMRSAYEDLEEAWENIIDTDTNNYKIVTQHLKQDLNVPENEIPTSYQDALAKSLELDTLRQSRGSYASQYIFDYKLKPMSITATPTTNGWDFHVYTPFQRDAVKYASHKNPNFSTLQNWITSPLMDEVDKYCMDVLSKDAGVKQAMNDLLSGKITITKFNADIESLVDNAKKNMRKNKTWSEFDMYIKGWEAELSTKHELRGMLKDTSGPGGWASDYVYLNAINLDHKSSFKTVHYYSPKGYKLPAKYQEDLLDYFLVGITRTDNNGQTVPNINRAPGPYTYDYNYGHNLDFYHYADEIVDLYNKAMTISMITFKMKQSNYAALINRSGSKFDTRPLSTIKGIKGYQYVNPSRKQRDNMWVMHTLLYSGYTKGIYGVKKTGAPEIIV